MAQQYTMIIIAVGFSIGLLEVRALPWQHKIQEAKCDHSLMGFTCVMWCPYSIMYETI